MSNQDFCKFEGQLGMKMLWCDAVVLCECSGMHVPLQLGTSTIYHPCDMAMRILLLALRTLQVGMPYP
jgi:hypothetical protein